MREGSSYVAIENRFLDVGGSLIVAGMRIGILHEKIH